MHIKHPRLIILEICWRRIIIHPNENVLLDLDRSDTHIHNIEAKRCKVNNDSATYLWHCRFHIGLKRMKKIHADGLLESLDYE